MSKWYEGTNIIERAFVVRRKHQKVRTPRSADVQRKGVRVENGQRNVEEGVRTEKGCRGRAEEGRQG